MFYLGNQSYQVFLNGKAYNVMVNFSDYESLENEPVLLTNSEELLGDKNGDILLFKEEE